MKTRHSVLARCRCEYDVRLSGTSKVQASLRQLSDLFQPHQNDSQWSIAPKDPTLPLTPDNAVVIPSALRRYLMARWRASRDLPRYQRALTLRVNVRAPEK
jgi:hypothetical protein